MMARLFAMGVALTASGTVAGSSIDDVLSKLRWSQRVLLVLAPTLDDPKARGFRERFSQRACEVADRDIVLMQVPAAGDAWLDGVLLAPDQAAAIREGLGDGSPFQVILLGKDGAVKLRERRVPDLDAVFALIDGMPMRRAEMRADGTACGR